MATLEAQNAGSPNGPENCPMFFPPGFDIRHISIQEGGKSDGKVLGAFHLAGKGTEGLLAIVGLTRPFGITWGVYCGDRETQTKQSTVKPKEDGSPVFLRLPISLILSPPSNAEMRLRLVIRDHENRRIRLGNLDVMLQKSIDHIALEREAEAAWSAQNWAQPCNRIDGEPQD